MTQFRHVLRLKTARYVSSLEDWLDRNCEGGFAIRLDDISEELDTKRYLVYFEFPSDLAVFKWALSQRTMPDRPDMPKKKSNRSSDGRGDEHGARAL